MVEPTLMNQTIDAFWGGVIKGDGRVTEYDLIRALEAMGARPVEMLDAIVRAQHLGRGFTAAIASDLVATLPGCGIEVATHLRESYGIHPVSMLFGTPFADLADRLEAIGLASFPARWLEREGWVKGLETLPGHPLNLVGVATWPIGTFIFHGRPGARIALPGLDVDSDLDLRDCDLFGFSDRVGDLHLGGTIRGGSVDVVGLSMTEGPTDLGGMQALRSSHHTHVLSADGAEDELRLPRFAPERVEFVHLTQ